MKFKLLIGTIFATPFITNANVINEQLNNHSFLLKNWYEGTERCLENQNYIELMFVDCFLNKEDSIQKEKIKKQLVTFENNRLYLVNKFSPEEKYCMVAVDRHNIRWRNDCEGTKSVFDIISQPSSLNILEARFQLKSRAYETCLTVYPSNATHLMGCEPHEFLPPEQQSFAAAIKTPMIHLEVTNQSSNPRNLNLQLQDTSGQSLYEKELKNIENSAFQSLYFPDFQSYLQIASQGNLNTTGDEGEIFFLSLEEKDLRAGDIAKVTINNDPLNISLSKYETAAIKLNNADRTNLFYTQDQNSLEPFASTRTTHVLPKGAVIALFSGENFEVQDKNFNNILFKFAGDSNIEAGTLYASVRVLRANEEQTYKITNAKGGLTWISEKKEGQTLGRLSYSGLVNSGQGADYNSDLGLFNYKTAKSAKWQRGAVFCEPSILTVPECAMLKTDYSAKDADFNDQTHWHSFPFKAYKDNGIKKGELFYEHSGMNRIDLWYAKRDGSLSKFSIDKQENDDWFYMGNYHSLLMK